MAITCCAGAIAPLRWRVLGILIATMVLRDAGATDEFTTMGPLGTTDAGDAGLILRLNYGVTAVRIKKIKVIDGYFTHTFHIELPEERSQQARTSNRPSNITGCDSQCIKFMSIYEVIDNMTQVMEKSVQQTIFKIYQLLPDQDKKSQVRRRQNRGLFNFMGTVSHYLFGTATDQSVDELRETVKHVKDIAETQSQEVRHIRQNLATVSRLQNNRIDNLKNAVDLERQSIVELFNQLKVTKQTENVEMDVIALMGQRITSYVSIHDDVLNLENGIDELIHHRLTTKLIPVDQMELAILHANANVLWKGARIYQRSVQEIYASRVFDYARFGRDLVIRIYLPYYTSQFGNERLRSTFNVFRVKIFPMAVPGMQGLITELKDFPKLFIANVPKDKVGTIEEVPTDGIIKQADVNWQSEMSCVFAIVTNRPELAHRICNFVVRKEEIVPKAYKLRDYKDSEFHVITNATNMILTCDNSTEPSLSEIPPANCSLCLLKLRCNCGITADRLQLSANLLNCNTNNSTESGNSEVLHAVNLVLLQKFYELDNQSMNAELLKVTSQVIDPQDIKIPLFSENTTRILAQDQQQSYVLNRIVEAMENTTDHITHGSAEALLFDYIQSHSTEDFWDLNWWSFRTWGVALLYVGFVAFGAYYYRRSKADTEVIKRLMLAVAGSHTLPTAEGYKLKETTPFTTLQSYAIDQDVLRDQILTYVEHAQTPVIILIWIAIMVLAWYCWYSLRRRSFVYMDISGGTNQILVKLAQLPNSSQNFTLKQTTAKFTVANLGIFAIIILEQPWKIKNIVTAERIELRKWALISRRTAKILVEIMIEPNPKLLALFVHTHSFEYVRPPNQLRLEDGGIVV